MDTPAFMKSAMKNLLLCLRKERQMYESIGDWLLNKEDWSDGSLNGFTYSKLLGATSEAADAWRIKVKLEAKRYGVKVPRKWN